MDIGLEARADGYRWTLQQERHSEYDSTVSYAAFAAKFGAADAVPGDEHQLALWQAWEQGVADSGWLLREDEMLSVSDISERTGFDRSYIKAEIVAKRLSALKYGRDYAVHPDDFRTWLKNPRRGSRSK